jgi:hypothetical protein
MDCQDDSQLNRPASMQVDIFSLFFDLRLSLLEIPTHFNRKKWDEAD